MNKGETWFISILVVLACAVFAGFAWFTIWGPWDISGTNKDTPTSQTRDSLSQSDITSQDIEGNKSDGPVPGMPELKSPSDVDKVKIIKFEATSPPKRPTLPKEDTADEWDAFFMSQTFVEKRLIAPSTAKFASLRQSQITKENKNTWIIQSYVDSQNNFGAMIRTHYRAKLTYVGDDMWRLLDVQFYE